MITSLNNDQVKQVIALQSRRQARHKASLFVIEGRRMVQEAVLSGVPISCVYYTGAFAESPEGLSLLEQLSTRGPSLIPVSDPVMVAMSDTQTPQGVLAVLPTPRLEPPDSSSFALIIDGVSDPGNLGTIMRAAAAAGVPQLIVTGGTVDITNPKVVRSAMGAHFRLPVRSLSWEGIAERLADHAIFLADVGGGAPYFRVNWEQPCALIVSDEAHGPGPDALRLAQVRVTIPLPGGMESLNVAMAACVLLFEMVRQRMLAADA